MLAEFGMSSVLSILSHLLFIGLAWWALQAINYEKFLRPNRVTQARLLLIFVAIMLGTAVSNFFLDYINWAQQIPYILE
ncbi:DUF1146 family protein [Caldibacillus lycopersici]|uniref:DUF1146 family protein n=1 Tax=Perspicuibacillus lycopersici TaxID=1325689 RepID=A0AAE3ITR9_9BACI|nr:DUF1146 family protein [Perspicuibacillus lycopersici]MCU9613294.1 DUF1146 family protein [Perspicuibacillus lycopersici]